MKKSDKLYRYRSDSSYSLNAILEDKIYAVCPTELNDKFDCHIKYNISKLTNLLINDSEYKVILARRAFGTGFLFSGHKLILLSDISDDECLDKLSKKSNRRRVKDCVSIIAESTIKRFKESFGIVSYTTNKNNEVMWSHYSNDSKGIVLGYDSELMQANLYSWKQNENYEDLERYNLYQFNLIGLHKVVYGKSKDHTNLLFKLIKLAHNNKNANIGIDIVIDSETYDEVIDVLTRKNSAWSYEKEYRIIVPYPLNGFSEYFDREGNLIRDRYFEIISDTPCEIYIGRKAEKRTIAAIRYFGSIKKTIKLK